MSDSELILQIQSMIPKDTANADTIARRVFNLAVVALGNRSDMDFNRTVVDFTLANGRAKHEIGVHILVNLPRPLNMQYLERRGTTRGKIEIVGLEKFQSYARGASSTTGIPEIATLYGSNPEILEVWPVPNAAYTVSAVCKYAVTQFKDIPEQYHPALLGMGELLLKSPAALVKELLGDLSKEQLVSWSGSQVLTDSTLIGHQYESRATSENVAP